jgi:aspartyl-tRNA synthetase
MFVAFDCLFYKPLILGDIEGISALVSSMDPVTKEDLLRRCSAGPNDLILFAVGHHASVNKTLDRLRVYVAHELGLIDHVSWYLLFRGKEILYFSIFHFTCNIWLFLFEF